MLGGVQGTLGGLGLSTYSSRVRLRMLGDAMTRRKEEREGRLCGVCTVCGLYTCISMLGIGTEERYLFGGLTIALGYYTFIFCTGSTDFCMYVCTLYSVCMHVCKHVCMHACT